MNYKSRYLDIVLLAVSLYSVFFIIHKFLDGKIPFWDFHIIYCSSKTFFLGNFPYGLDVHGDCLHPNITLSGNYSPGTLEILKYLGALNIFTANIVWVFFEVISLLIIFLISKKIFKFNSGWRNFFIFFFSFGGTIFLSFISGNTSVILHGVLALGVYFLYNRSFHYFYFSVLFISCFKFYYMAFLILPFYIAGFKSFKHILSYIFLFFTIQYFFYLKNPELTIAFFEIIQGKSGDILPTRFLTGTGMYSIIEKMPWIFLNISDFKESFFSLETNLFIWIFISFTISLTLFFCLNNKKLKESKSHILFCISFGILVTNLVIPRLVVYDLILTVPVIFYLLNKIDFNKFNLNNLKLKNFVIFLFLIFFDHHFPFFIIILFITLFIYSELFKKKIFIY